MIRNIVFVTLFFISFFSYGNDESYNDKTDDNKVFLKKLEDIVYNSNLDIKEKAEVSELIAKKVNSYEPFNSNNDLNKTVENVSNNVEKYKNFGSDMALFLIKTTSEIGVSVDSFLSDSFWGKIILFGIFLNFGGGVFISFFIKIILFIFYFKVVNKTALFYLREHQIKTEIISLKPFYKRVFSKDKFYKKDIFIPKKEYNSEDNRFKYFVFVSIIPIVIHVLIIYL